MFIEVYMFNSYYFKMSMSSVIENTSVYKKHIKVSLQIGVYIENI